MRKVTIDASSNTEKRRIYDGQWELYTHKTAGTIDLTRETLHIMDDKARIALVDTPTFNTTGSGETQNLRYQFSNHLSTGTLELDFNAANISYEEYYPFGSTSFQSGRSAAEVSLKRYRYTAKERDEETGLYYHGARYYAPWLGRWLAVDPLEGKFSPETPYNYGHNNPITWQDSTGTQPDHHNQVLITPGTTLSSIAQQYHTSVNQLLKENPNIKDPNKIRAWDYLNLPKPHEFAQASSSAHSTTKPIQHANATTSKANTSSAPKQSSNVAATAATALAISAEVETEETLGTIALADPEPVTKVILGLVVLGMAAYTAYQIYDQNKQRKAPETTAPAPTYPNVLPLNPPRTIPLTPAIPITGTKTDRPDDDLAQIRIQVQTGHINIASDIQLNTMETGVLKAQAWASLKIVYNKAIAEDPSLAKNKDFRTAVIRMSQKIKAIKGGISRGNYQTELQETFTHNRLPYRVDLEVIRGHNLRY